MVCVTMWNASAYSPSGNWFKNHKSVRMGGIRGSLPSLQLTLLSMLPKTFPILTFSSTAQPVSSTSTLSTLVPLEIPPAYILTSRSYSTSSIRIATAAAVDNRGLQYSDDVTDCKVGG